MGWVRLSDDFYDHRKFAEAGPLGISQWVAGLAWSNRNLSDGFIPTAAARRLLDWTGIASGSHDTDGDEVSEHLVACGLWEEADGGYQIHDYHDYQPPAAEMKAKRAAISEKRRHAGRAGGEANGKQTSKQNGSKREATDEAKSEATSEQNGSPNPNPKESPPTPPQKPSTPVAPARVEAVKDEQLDKLLARWLSIFTTAGPLERERSRVVIDHLCQHLDDQAVDEILGHAERDLTSPPRRSVVLMSIAQSWASEHGMGRIPELPSAGPAPPSKTRTVPNKPIPKELTQP